ncbi:MAG TPA: OsmC family protein [Terriglobales bacterium]|nr:OsmC family protein [Terriglobales bacterium]
MLGTFGGALEARKIDASHGKLIAHVRGEVESDGGVLVIRRVYVKFRLQAPPEARDTVERVHSIYADKCPVYRILRPAMEIQSSYEFA